MKKSPAVAPELQNLAEDAKGLLAATAQGAEDKVVAVRHHLSAALEQGRKAWEFAKGIAVEGVDSAEVAVRTHPYRALGLAFGVGALIACLSSIVRR